MFLSVVTSARSCPKFNSICRIILRDTIEVETIFIFQLYPIYKIYKWDNHPYYHIYSYLTIISNMIQAFYHLGTDQPLSIRDPAPFPGLCCCDLDGPCKARELQTSELPRNLCRFPNFSENSGKLWKWNCCFHFKVRLRNGVVQRV